jgi:hypothetical protein
MAGSGPAITVSDKPIRSKKLKYPHTALLLRASLSTDEIAAFRLPRFSLVACDAPSVYYLGGRPCDGGIDEPSIGDEASPRLAMHCSLSCGSVMGPHSFRIRDWRKPGLVRNKRSYWALSALLREADQEPWSLALACGLLVGTCVFVCAFAGIAPKASAHPAANAIPNTALLVIAEIL